MKVDIREIERCLRYFKTINNTDFHKLSWFDGDKPLTVTKEQADEFNYMGLSNRDFPSVIGWMPDDVGIRVTTMTMTRATPPIDEGKEE